MCPLPLRERAKERIREHKLGEGFSSSKNPCEANPSPNSNALRFPRSPLPRGERAQMLPAVIAAPTRANVSISCGERPAPAVVHADLRSLHGDVDGLAVEFAGDAARARDVDLAEIEIGVFGLRAPAPGKHPFETAARGPADHHLVAGHVQ